ncbi:MAG: PQQ-binding-like beta-propeller repeat protein [Acidobacteria bacterium]|nr:PQQ-binding-like beta-propeller repeat protein [Acidobacteriota bacterium]
MRVKGFASVLISTVLIASLGGPLVEAQNKGTVELENQSVRAGLGEEATRVTVGRTTVGTVTRYDENVPPKVDAATSTNWLLHNLDLANSRYVDMDQINTTNVKSLVRVWEVPQMIPNPPLRENNNAQCAPIVVDGIMYVTDYPGNVFALNAETGAPLWTFRINDQITLDEVHQGGTGATRGVVYGDGIIYAVAAASLFALDAKTGKPIESFGTMGRCNAVLDILKAKYPEVTKPIDKGFWSSMAPQYYEGMVILGAGASERLCPGGLILALDAKTGRLIWHFNTIPQGPEDQGWEIAGPTWVGTGPRAGGSIWETPAIDPDLGLLYAAIANPMPFGRFGDGSYGANRHGLNLFTCGILALEVATGRPKQGWGADYNGDGIGDGFFQQVHHDVWDWDSAHQPILFEAQVAGRTVKALAEANKNGLLYFLNRETGKPVFSIEEYAVPTMAVVPGDSLWPTQPFPFSASGRLMNTVPLVATDIPASSQHLVTSFYAPPNPTTGVIRIPGVRGGNNAAPPSRSPRTGLLYFNGIDAPTAFPATNARAPRAYVTAWDMNTGDLVWQRRLESSAAGSVGLTATAGDVVFVGENSGLLHAFDARTGEELWNFSTPGMLKAPPTVFMLNDRQYVSVKSGTTVFTFALPVQ